MLAQKRALRITINIIRNLAPIILRLIEQIDAARSSDSDGGKQITKEERWNIAYNASIVALPEIIDAITEAIE